MTVPENKLYDLYEAVMDGTSITESNIHSFGLNIDEIRCLLNAKVLKYVGGVYYLNDVDGFWKYGKRLISLKRKDRAKVCFEKCLEINPNHKKTAFQLFIGSLQQRDFNRAFELFKIVDNNENPYIQADLNYFLFLLSFLIVLPPEYNERARSFKIDDLYCGDDMASQGTPFLKKVRISSFNQFFSLAQDQLEEMIEVKQRLSSTDLITRTFLYYIARNQKNVRRGIRMCLDEESFEDILNYFSELEEMHNLNHEYELMRLLIQDIVDLLVTGEPRERIYRVRYKTEANVAALKREYGKVLGIVNSTSISYTLAEYLVSLTDEFYGLKDAKELMILISADFSVEDVRASLKLSDENYQLLLAVLAKKCYQNGDISEGDAYIAKLESEEGKSRRVEFALRDVKLKRPIERVLSDDEKSFILEVVRKSEN